MAKPTIYVSVDVETDGPIPGRNSMLSLGAAAYSVGNLITPETYKHINTYHATLQPLPEATPDPDTMEWWQRQPEAYEVATKDARPAEVVIPEFIGWLNRLPGKPTFVAYPAGFDFTYVHWYNVAFGGGQTASDPFGFSAVDIKSYAAAYLDCPYRQATKRNMPKRWFKTPSGAPPFPRHNHQALDDAIGQGMLFLNILNDLADLKDDAR